MLLSGNPCEPFELGLSIYFLRLISLTSFTGLYCYHLTIKFNPENRTIAIAINSVRVIISLLSLILLTLGVQWLFVPETMTNQFAVIPNGLPGWATFRADFGSFFIVSGITGLLAISNLRGANHYLICGALLMAFAALGRIVGFVSDGVSENGVTPLIFELVTLASFTALASLRSRQLRQTRTEEASTGEIT